MPGVRSRWVGVALAAALMSTAAAEPAPITPPSVAVDSAPVYPPEALAAGREADVGVLVTIGADGRVEGARLAAPQGDPLGAALDAAALDAAAGLRFVPARQGGEPIAVEVAYVYRFRLPAPLPAPRPTPEPAPEPAPAPPDDRLVVIAASPATARRRSAEAVTVVEAAAARRETSDLGDVLARVHGVGVRRSGGLGAATRLSLNGLTDDQIRVLVDGVPLEYAGYGVGLAHLPLDLVDRVEIYRGVVPIRLGADALGGAIDVVTERRVDGTGGSAAWQFGAFGTHRLSLGAHHRFAPRGLFVRGHAFYDVADNDYPVDVEVVDARGRPSPATVDRFHDAYRAGGGGLEVGVTDRPWADWLSLRGFVTDHSKEIQHNVVMTRPFGEPVAGRRAAGGALRYALAGERAEVEAQLGYGHRQSDFVDEGEWLYDWRGERLLRRQTPGELDGQPHDRTTWEDAAYARVDAAWHPAPGHTLRLALAPTYSARTGTERRRLRPEDRDPLALDRRVFSLVTGLEHRLVAWGGRVENLLFVKDFRHRARADELEIGGGRVERTADLDRQGFGDALRVRLTEGLTVKASYERATRLPRPDELFGDTVTVVANPELAPEVSHNANLGLTLDADTALGALRFEVHGFARLVDDLIVLWGTDQVLVHQNVYGARALGVEAAGRWRAFDRVELGGNVTWQDVRNTSSDGAFGAFEGDRIPNRPWLFANGDVRFTARDVWPGLDVELGGRTRYVHGFYRGWESIGAREGKQTVPAQWIHDLVALARLRVAALDTSAAVELTNVGDARAYDHFGVQRPGRALYGKLTVGW